MTMITSHEVPGQLAQGQFERIAKALSDPRRFAMLKTISEEHECANQALCSDKSPRPVYRTARNRNDSWPAKRTVATAPAGKHSRNDH